MLQRFQEPNKEVVFAAPPSKQGFMGPGQMVGGLHHSSCSSLANPRAVFPRLHESSGVEKGHECECTLPPGHSELGTQGWHSSV